jgi:hypothetical protein
VVCTVGALFQLERNPSKARKWFNRAAAMAPDIGDVWAAYYSFELASGTEVCIPMALLPNCAR